MVDSLLVGLHLTVVGMVVVFVGMIVLVLHLFRFADVWLHRAPAAPALAEDAGSLTPQLVAVLLTSRIVARAMGTGRSSAA